MIREYIKSQLENQRPKMRIGATPGSQSDGETWDLPLVLADDPHQVV